MTDPAPSSDSAVRHRSEDVLRAVSFAAERLLRARNWRDVADEVLSHLGRASRASRVYLFENRVDAEGVLRACHLAEWTADGIDPQLDVPELRNPPYDPAFARWAEILSAGEQVEGLVSEFPPGEQELLRAQDIRSLVVVPVFVQRQWWGFLGFDECREDRQWSTAERAALRTAVNILGAAIQRDLAEEEVRRRDEQLRRAERLASLGTLIGGVAHELNNPLTSIRGLAELLLGDAESQRQRDMLRTVVREADRTSKIVGDLRLLARRTQDSAQSGETVDVNDVARHVLELRRYALETHNVELETDLAEDLPEVRCDAGRLEQVLINLVVNAEQALEEIEGHRRLTLRTGRAEKGVRIEVADSGPGVPEEHLRRLFDPFWTTKDPTRGTGLGLSLAHKIVDEHGGEIDVQSEPGVGTTFTVLLPAGSATDAAADTSGETAEIGETTEEMAEEGTDPRSYRILVVDDEAAIRRILLAALGQRGHEVDEAEDGEAALVMAENRPSPYDLVVSDLRMSGLSGEELLERLREVDGRYAERMIFVTGDTFGVDADSLADQGIPVVQKPFALGEIVDLAERHAAATITATAG